MMILDEITVGALIAALIVVVIMFIMAVRSTYSDSGAVYQVNEDSVNDFIEEQTNVMAQRVQLILNSINLLWNSLLIDDLLKVDNVQATDAIQTTSVLLSEDVICVYSIYLPRSLRILCELSWSRQEMYIRVEQQMSNGVVEAQKTFKIKGGVLSSKQADKISSQYFKKLIQLAEIDIEDKEEDESAENEEVESEN